MTSRDINYCSIDGYFLLVMSQQDAIPCYLGILFVILFLVPIEFTLGYHACGGEDLTLCAVAGAAVALIVGAAMSYGVWRDHRPAPLDGTVTITL